MPSFLDNLTEKSECVITQSHLVCSDYMLEQYLQKCRADKLLSTTIRDKRRRLTPFVENYTLDRDGIYAFLNSLNTTPCVEKNIRKDLRAFLKHLNESGLCSVPYTIVKSLPYEGLLKPMVLPEEYELMRAECEKLIQSKDKERYKTYITWLAVLDFLWDTGLRRGELANIEIKNVDIGKKTFYVKTEKTNKWRQGWFRCDLTNYLETIKPQGRLFNICGKTVGYIVYTLKNLAQIKRDISAHSFRHSYATILLNNGANIVDVAHLMGHDEIKTTMRYAHSINLEKVYEKYKTGLNNYT